MSEFEFVFVLYSLVMGLSLVELLAVRLACETALLQTLLPTSPAMTGWLQALIRRSARPPCPSCSPCSAPWAPDRHRPCP